MNAPDWVSSLKAFARADAARAVVQMVNTLIPYGLSLLALFLVLRYDLPWLLLIPLYVLASGFYIRIFIQFHDCVHGSFLRSRRANRVVGYLTGILTFTSFDEWRRSHLIHHGTVGNIDKKGVGDIWTLTTEEYQKSPLKRKLLYRLYRNPFFLFLVAPVFLFAVVNRFPTPGKSRRENLGILFTDLMIGGIILLVSLTVGFRYYLIIQLPILFIASSCGLWLFYVQHQFEHVYWSRSEGWDVYRAAIEGSSYYRLPAVLQWFTGNIGFHHIHHLNSKIPNYKLKKCQQELAVLKEIPSLSLFGSLKTMRLKLYDEASRKMVGFSEFKRMRTRVPV